MRRTTERHQAGPAPARVSPAQGLHDAAQDLNAAVLVVGATHRGVAESRGALELARDLVPPRIRGDVELLPGRPEDALAEMSAELDLLVCGSRGYGPLRTVLLGGVSSSLAHRSGAPFMIVPRGTGWLPDAPGGVGLRAFAAGRLLTSRSMG